MKYCPECKTPLTEQQIDGRTRLACPACTFVFWNNPTPVVAGIVDRGDRIVMTHKREWPADRFGLVAGFPEANETAEGAVLREIREETNLEGEIVRLIGVYSSPARNQFFIVYHVRVTGGTLQVGEELESVREVGLEELPEVISHLPPESGSRKSVTEWLAEKGQNQNINTKTQRH